MQLYLTSNAISETERENPALTSCFSTISRAGFQCGHGGHSYSQIKWFSTPCMHAHPQWRIGSRGKCPRPQRERDRAVILSSLAL
jgi:hypothetical protein